MEPSGERRDPTERREAIRQPLLQDAPPDPLLPLHACLLSGGESRRMGRDKALLPHPEDGTWLEHSLKLLLDLAIPVTLLSRHQRHLQLAQALTAGQSGGPSGRPPGGGPAVGQPGASPLQAAPAEANPTACAPDTDLVSPASGEILAPESTPPGAGAWPRLIALAEPPPWEGPLLALHRLMEHYPEQRLLLCPVDMPWLTPQVLRTLLQAAAEQPQRIHLAHDGERLQPLLGIYPSSAPIRAQLAAAVEAGERRLQGWLATQAMQPVRLDPLAIRNVNRPEPEPSNRNAPRSDQSAGR
jgi:molybdopterin-guanine dinucleotide biosynthesis protein A